MMFSDRPNVHFLKLKECSFKNRVEKPEIIQPATFEAVIMSDFDVHVLSTRNVDKRNPNLGRHAFFLVVNEGKTFSFKADVIPLNNHCHQQLQKKNV